MRFVTGLSGMVLAWASWGLGAQTLPNQLCESALTPPTASLSIGTNYRYPADRASRSVNRLQSADRCDLPFDEVYLYEHPSCRWFKNFSCGDLGGVRTDECRDSAGWWGGVSIVRSTRWAEPQTGVLLSAEPWVPNPAVRVLWGYPGFQQVERFRVFPWDSTNGTQSEGVQDVPITTGAYPRCYTMAHLFGFFNGVWNTRTEAEDSLDAMKTANFLGAKWREAPVRYELFYNQTCKRSEDDGCLQDVAEVFRQRSAELDGLLARRWEYFWEQVTGQHDQPGSFTQRLLARLVRSDKALANWFNGLYNAVLAKITALSTLLADNPPTAADTAAHTAQLIAAGQRAERAVLVAHSQGNLFVNAAYDAYLAHSRAAGRAQGEDTNYVAAQVVHIAPASPTLRGPYVLADIDIVINGLRRVDGTYLAVSNFPMAFEAKDRSGHKLLSTYLDEARPARAHILQLIQQGLDAL